MPTYTNTYTGCSDCCKCPILPQLVLRCPGLIPTGATEFCFKATVSHTITGMTSGGVRQWVPPSPFSIIGKAISRCSGNANLVNLIPSTSGAHTQDPVKYPHLVLDYGQIDYQTNPPSVYLAIPFTSTTGKQFNYNFSPTGTAGAFACSPFSDSVTNIPVWMYDDGGNIIASFQFMMTIELATCPGPTAPTPVPFLTQATQPCKYLGPQIEDSAKCGCGTANLMECRIYGTCRRTGTPTSGEQVCITCPDYKKAP